MRDDELLESLGDALGDDVPAIDQRRIDALRAAAEQSRDERRDATVLELPKQRRHQTRTRLIAAASVIAVAAMAAMTLRWSQADDPGELEFAGAIGGPSGQAQLTVVKTGIGRVIDLDTEDLAILPKGEYYEVWFVGPGDGPDTPNRISVGTFHPDAAGRSDVTFAGAVDPALLPRVEITAEPADGDPRASDVVVLEADLSS